MFACFLKIDRLSEKVLLMEKKLGKSFAGCGGGGPRLR